MRFVIEPMRLADIPAVSAIERLSFPQPWPQSAYRREIQDNRMAHYIVARLAPDGSRPQAAVEARPAEATGEPKDEATLIGRLQRLFRNNETGAALEPEERELAGYAGLWLMTDEAHVTTIAVHPDFRGMYVGELLLLSLIDAALARKGRWVTLEVRVSNAVAQALYRKYTFREMGVRKRYYSDNGEDALVMWTDPLDSERFLQALEQNRATLLQRLGEG